MREGTVAQPRGSGRLLVRATPQVQAEACLVRLLGSGARRGGMSSRRPPASGAPEISRRLVEAGLELYQLRQEDRGLEDVFPALGGEHDSREAGRVA